MLGPGSHFSGWLCLMARLSRRVGGVPLALGVSFLVAGMGSVRSAWFQGLQAADRGGDLGGPGPVCGQAELLAPAAADQPPGHGEDPQAQAFGFPPAGLAVKGEQLHPGQQLAGHGHQFGPDLVGGIAVQGQVAQAGVLGAADAVLAAGPEPVP